VEQIKYFLTKDIRNTISEIVKAAKRYENANSDKIQHEMMVTIKNLLHEVREHRKEVEVQYAAGFLTERGHRIIMNLFQKLQKNDSYRNFWDSILSQLPQIENPIAQIQL